MAICTRPRPIVLAVALVLALASSGPAAAQHLIGDVVAHAKLSATQGGLDAALAAPLADGDLFGSSLAALGDLDGDGSPELLAGASGDDDGGADRGAAHVVFLARDGSAASVSTISTLHGGLGDVLADGVAFGGGVAALGDLDGDGVPDAAVGAGGTDGGRGAVWVLFLQRDGSVRRAAPIASGAGGLPAVLDVGDRFGDALAGPGDVDGDGVPDLAVGARFDDDGGGNRGAVWLLLLRRDGTVRAHVKIDGAGGVPGLALDDGDQFGASVAALGDHDGNGVPDLAVGADGDDDGAATFIGSNGAVWLLFLERGGTVRRSAKISATSGGFDGDLDELDVFGRSVAALGDLDGDGAGDLAVGADGDDDGGLGHGALWVLLLRRDGTVRGTHKISSTSGHFAGDLDEADRFGHAAAALGDLDGDGVVDLAASAWRDDDGGAAQGTDRGAAWILFLNAGAWLDLGGGVAGAAGVPRLTGAGTLLPGTDATLHLRGAPPRAVAYAIVGLGAAHTPFHGGVLVPSPDAVLVAGATDASGALTVGDRWPHGLQGDAEVFVQVWLRDVAAPGGYAASNAVMARTP